MSEAAAHAIDHHEPVTSTGIPNKKVLMWAFLGSDCMFFGTLISTHLIYSKISATVNGTPLDIRNIFDIELTSFSTFILLASSLFMALAVSAIHKGNLKSTRWMLLELSYSDPSSLLVRCMNLHISFITEKKIRTVI